jgi:uncharacterized Zn finger protein
MPREAALDKGLRYLVSGRLVIQRLDGHVIEARCRGDRGEVYRLGFRPGAWYCECPARTDCSHLFALWRVTVRPRSAA